MTFEGRHISKSCHIPKANGFVILISTCGKYGTSIIRNILIGCNTLDCSLVSRDITDLRDRHLYVDIPYLQRSMRSGIKLVSEGVHIINLVLMGVIESHNFGPLCFWNDKGLILFLLLLANALRQGSKNSADLIVYLIDFVSLG